MNQQFDNQLDVSFNLWAENFLLNKNQAFINNTSQLYYTPDPRLGTGYVAYSSPFKQWVYDSGVSGAYIPDSISGSFGTLSRGQSGLKFDYANGRIILNAAMGTGLRISGSYAIKELNFYTTNETDEMFIIQNKYYFNPRYFYKSTAGSGIKPYDIVSPCIFINNLNSRNIPFALGGMDETLVNMSLVVMAEDKYSLTAVLSRFRDSNLKYFPILDLFDDPINEWGDLKSGFNYKTLCEQKGYPGNLFEIKSVQVSKLSDSLKTNEKLFMGFVDVDVCFARYPRQ